MMKRLLLLCGLLVIVISSGTVLANADIPRLEFSDCQFFNTLDDVQCGYLLVPENRSDPNSPTVRIHFAILKATGKDPQPDPIIYLDGGPGSHTLDFVNARSGFDGLNIERDVILFDQRGIGYSEPALNCPEVNDYHGDNLAVNTTAIEANKRLNQPLQACRDRLVEAGVNLSAYTTAENAADVDDLRRMLGYKKWNLYGGSYGTMLALAVMRDYPEGVRSAVLASPVPPQVNWLLDMPVNADRAFQMLFDRCEEDRRCSRFYPDLETVFFETIQELNANPALVEVHTPHSNSPQEVVVRGDTYVSLAFTGLYSDSLIGQLPRIIYEAAEGEHEIAAYRLSSRTNTDDRFSTGMHRSIICNDEINFENFETLAASDIDFPEQQGVFNGMHYRDMCLIWDVQGAETVETEPVVSAIPTLVLSGEFDPITPPRYGELVNDTLKNSYFYVLPHTGHSVASTGCVRIMMRGFFTDPLTEPDSSCIKDIPRIRFAFPW